MADDSRSAILGRLRAARPRHAPAHPPPARRPVPPSPVETMTLFLDRLAAARATAERVAALADVPAAAARYLAGQNLPARLTVAPDLRLDFSNAALTLEDALPVADGAAVLTGCIAGVAETGTLVIASGEGRDPRLDYLAETLIVLVGTSQVTPVYEDVWTRLRVRTGRETPRLVSFITGPSRTADIEQTIEWGAHGPRRMHVLICDETP